MNRLDVKHKNSVAEQFYICKIKFLSYHCEFILISICWFSPIWRMCFIIL